MPSAPLLEREFLEKLERLTIHWQKSFPGLVGGHNISRFAGAGQEFLDHRNFHHGDDLRAVNWRAYLRLEKLFLKMFQVEPRVPVRMLIDTSAPWPPSTASSSITRASWPARWLRRAGAAGYDRDPPLRLAAGRAHVLQRRPASLRLGGGLPHGDEGRRPHRFLRGRARVHLDLFAARPGDRDLRFPGRSGLRKAAAISGRFRPRAAAGAGLGGRGPHAAVAGRAGTGRRRNRRAHQNAGGRGARASATPRRSTSMRNRSSSSRCETAAGMSASPLPCRSKT